MLKYSIIVFANVKLSCKT